MKKVSKSQRNDSNGRILGKMRSSSAPSSQNPSMYHPNRSSSVDTEATLPTVLLPPSPPEWTHRREKHRPFSHQMTRLYISSETSESNKRLLLFFSLCGIHAPSPHYITSPFLAPHFSTQSCPQPLMSPRSSSSLRLNVTFPLSLSLFPHPLFVPLLMPFPTWKSKSQFIYAPLCCQNIYLRTLFYLPALNQLSSLSPLSGSSFPPCKPLSTTLH